MYLDFFQMKKPPYLIAPDDGFLFLSPQHSKALTYMDYAVWQPGGFVIITGEIGSGKTTLMKRLLRKLDRNITCLNLTFTNLEGTELLYSISKQARLDVDPRSKVSMLFALKKYLQEIRENNNPCVLVIDEAQNLSSENLEDIRMLASLEVNNKPLLRVIMLGQPEFMSKVNSSEQLKQRVKLHYHIGGMSKEEVSDYISYRLKMAGYNGEVIFDENTSRLIFKFSRGIPRLINKLCDALLMCAFADNRKVAKEEDIFEILDDLMIEKPEGDMAGEIGRSVNSKVASEFNASIGVDANISLKLLERAVKALEGINNNLTAIAKQTPKKGR